MSDITNKKTIKEYDLELPDRQMALTSLKRMVGEKEAQEIWEEACKVNNVPYDSRSIEDLSKVYKYMANKEGVVGVTGRSLNIRATSYRILSRIKNIK